MRILYRGEGLGPLARSSARATWSSGWSRVLRARVGRSRPRSTFNVFGERGSIDILAFHPAYRRVAGHRGQDPGPGHRRHARHARPQGPAGIRDRRSARLDARRPCRDSSWSRRQHRPTTDRRPRGRPSRPASRSGAVEVTSLAAGADRPDRGPDVPVICGPQPANDTTSEVTRARRTASRQAQTGAVAEAIGS